MFTGRKNDPDYELNKRLGFAEKTINFIKWELGGQLKLFIL